MKAVVQRVKEANVVIDNKVHSEIKQGIVVLVGIKEEDNLKDIDYIIDKITNLRIFPDENGVMNKSMLEMNYELLVVPNFTIYGSTKKGRRPSYILSAKPEIATKTFDLLLSRLDEKNIKFKSGVFQAMMDVKIINDGPITLIVES